MSGKFIGVQRLMKEVEGRALYVHCLNHCLNLSLQDVTKSVPLIRDVLQWINDVGVLLNRSAKR